MTKELLKDIFFIVALFGPNNKGGRCTIAVTGTGRTWWQETSSRRYDDDPDINRHVAEHNRNKGDLRARRRMVNPLTSQGMIALDAMSGASSRLSSAGFFRPKGLLIGPRGLLVLFRSTERPFSDGGDADIARGYAISGGNVPPVAEVLQGVDASFRPVPHRSETAAL